ncbi:GT4 family glycosyltransferase PelF [Metabacillus litoralis]|uniref:GT4 family glycosyltransferase PelF n=1 Tax=Metabacillus litoralis TaxID=152268 RepID=UPI001CFE094D|nr:GT4 family glycosyltransferase PelF [Metabacillus litoralis]
MRICLITEGSYPYVTGGVSSWAQSLLTQLPQHEFIILSISAKKENTKIRKYKAPANLVEVYDIHLDSFLSEEIVSGKRYSITPEEKQAFSSLIGGDEINWPILFDLLVSERIDSILNFLASKDFFDIVYDLCKERFAFVPFTDMFWALRSMVLPLFICMNQKLPEADLYHSVSTGYAGVLGALAKHQYQKPYVLTEHGIYTREREEEIIKSSWIKGYFKDIWIDYFYNLSNCAYNYADEVTSLFEKNREIQVEIGCREEKTSIISNGIDITRFNIENRVSKDGLHVGGIVRVVPIKDIKTMLQSFAIVQQEIPNAYFYIIGPHNEDQDYYEECLDLVENLELKNVIFTGETDVKVYLEFLDVLVLSSISEGQPLVILEGLAMGIPYVTTDVGSCSELLLGANDPYGRAGSVVPVMHFHLLAQELINLLINKNKRIEYGQNGRNRVIDYYSLALMVRRYNECYERWGN